VGGICRITRRLPSGEISTNAPWSAIKTLCPAASARLIPVAPAASEGGGLARHKFRQHAAEEDAVPMTLHFSPAKRHSFSPPLTIEQIWREQFTIQHLCVLHNEHSVSDYRSDVIGINILWMAP